MTSSSKLLILSAALFAALLPSMAGAQQVPADALACSVSVEHTSKGVLQSLYAKDFVVSPTSPFSDDFSTASRWRTFDAKVVLDNGVPSVTIELDADVSTFDTVSFDVTLRVQDPVTGNSSSGSYAQDSSNGSRRTRYTLTCAQPVP